MSESKLVLHCGARIVSAEELGRVEAPPATRTWFPLSHAHVARTVENALAEGGFTVKDRQYALSRTDDRFFGVMDLASDLAPGVTLAVGVRNSMDKSLPIGFCAGSRVFTCDNLAFSSEVVVARKHTRFGDTRFTEALSRAVAGLAAFKSAESARIERYRARELPDATAESLMLRAYEKDIVSHRLLPRVIREWREPSYEDFAPRTLWSLMNAFTTVLGDRRKTNPQAFAHLTIRLSGLLDEAAPTPVLSQPA